MELILKALIIALVGVGAGWLARSGWSNLAALIIQLPLISIGALWVAGSKSALAEFSGKALLGVVVWVVYMASIWALAKYSNLDWGWCIGLGLVVWLVAAGVYLLLVPRG